MHQIHLLGFEARVTGPGDLLHATRALTPPAPSWTRAIAPVRSSAVFQFKRDGPQLELHHVLQDGAILGTTHSRDAALACLLWGVYGAALSHLREDFLLFHAAAVARGDRGLLLPAPSGHGKSTLVAGLLAAGFRYLGDDIAAVARSTLHLLPFGKSLAVKSGAVRALAPLYPALTAGATRLTVGGETVWHIPPAPGDWPAAPMPVRYVVLPRYVAQARTLLAPLPRSEALQQLLEQSFSVGHQGAGGVASSVALLQRADCYSLTVGRLDQAVDRLLELTAA